MSGNPSIVFKAPREVVVEDHDRPRPGEGEVLIQTRRSLISSGTELTVLSGEFPPQSYWAQYGKYPFAAGYANVGVVVELGKGVDPVWRGRRVASFSNHAAFVSVAVSELYEIPQAIPDEQATFFAIALIVMNGVRRARLSWGEAVAVYGLGLLGQFCVRCCALSGARPVMGIDVAPARIKLLPQTSAIVPLNSSETDVVARVRELTQERMADVVFEVTGNQNLIPGEFAILKKQGRFVVLSSPRGPSSFDFHDLSNAPSTTIIGAHQMSHPLYETPDNPWTKERNVELFFDLVTHGEIQLAPLISHRVSFSEAPAMYHQLLKDRSQAMGAIIQWD